MSPYTRRKKFVFRSGDGRRKAVRAADANEAFAAFSAFLDAYDAEPHTIEDKQARQSLVLMPGRRAIMRTEGSDPSRTEYLRPEGPRRYRPMAMLFLENGYRGLDGAGAWLPRLEDLDASAGARGAVRAAMFAAGPAAIEETARIWADSGIVDRSDSYYVFFESREVDDDEEARAELLILLDMLDLERVGAPPGAPSGEVWVRRDPRLDAELEQWA